MKKLIAILLAFIMIVSAVPVVFAAETETVILFTNDIHCSVDGFLI